MWKAEQKHDEEQKKIEQLKRELAEEERIYDLKKLQEAASGKYIFVSRHLSHLLGKLTDLTGCIRLKKDLVLKNTF